MVETIKVPMSDEATSSLGNVYSSKQHPNMPDRIIKQLLLKQLQVSKDRLWECEQNFQV